jgi:hypothetical protein
MMEAAIPDVAFEKGKFAITGTDRSVGIAEVADRGCGLRRGDRAARQRFVSRLFDAARRSVL